MKFLLGAKSIETVLIGLFSGFIVLWLQVTLKIMTYSKAFEITQSENISKVKQINLRQVWWEMECFLFVGDVTLSVTL